MRLQSRRDRPATNQNQIATAFRTVAKKSRLGNLPGGAAMEWIPTSSREPSGQVLIYADGKYFVALLAKDPEDPLDRGQFLDPCSCDLRPWPSHWTPLPAAPVG